MRDHLLSRIAAETRIRLVVKKCPAFGAVVERVCMLGDGDLAERLGGVCAVDDGLAIMLRGLSPACLQALSDFFMRSAPVLKTAWHDAALFLKHQESPVDFIGSELKLLEDRNPEMLGIWRELAASQETDEAKFTVSYAAACVAKLQRTHAAACRLRAKAVAG